MRKFSKMLRVENIFLQLKRHKITLQSRLCRGEKSSQPISSKQTIQLMNNTSTQTTEQNKTPYYITTTVNTAEDKCSHPTRRQIFEDVKTLSCGCFSLRWSYQFNDIATIQTRSNFRLFHQPVNR